MVSTEFVESMLICANFLEIEFSIIAMPEPCCRGLWRCSYTPLTCHREPPGSLGSAATFVPSQHLQFHSLPLFPLRLRPTILPHSLPSHPPNNACSIGSWSSKFPEATSLIGRSLTLRDSFVGIIACPKLIQRHGHRCSERWAPWAKHSLLHLRWCWHLGWSGHLWQKITLQKHKI